MSKTIAIIASGEMGSAIGSTLARHGARVVTSGKGRSDASIARAKAAGFALADSDDDLVKGADFVMSVVPPSAALDLAKRLAPALERTQQKPIYIDCNAVAPKTVLKIETALAQTGCPFVDGGLFGGPTSGKPGVSIYVSGPHAQAVQQLAPLGLVVRTVDGPVGAASAMKLSFAALNKGFTGIAVLSLIGGLKASAGPALIEQLAETQPNILAYVSRFIPPMFPKAYRWSPEMEEIAEFLGDDKEARDVFLALARLYTRVAKDVTEESEMVASLRNFCKDAAAANAALGKEKA